MPTRPRTENQVIQRGIGVWVIQTLTSRLTPTVDLALAELQICHHAVRSLLHMPVMGESWTIAALVSTIIGRIRNIRDQLYALYERGVHIPLRANMDRAPVTHEVGVQTEPCIASSAEVGVQTEP